MKHLRRACIVLGLILMLLGVNILAEQNREPSELERRVHAYRVATGGFGEVGARATGVGIFVAGVALIAIGSRWRASPPRG